MSNVELIGLNRKNCGQRETTGKRWHREPDSDLDLEVAMAKHQDSCRLCIKRQLPIRTTVLDRARSLRAEDDELVRESREVYQLQLLGFYFLAEVVHP